MAGTLDGIKIVDCCAGAQGPWAGALLSDLGAEVIKVEPPGGEWMRPGTPKKNGIALAAMGLNHGKRGIVLDLKTTKDMEVFLKLIERADVFVENWRAGVGDRMGIGYKDLVKVNPRIIYASSSGFGSAPGNAYATKPGMDTSSQAMSGMGSVSGFAGGPGELARFTILDLTGPLPIVQAILLALMAREQTGKGQWVQCSQTETGIVLQAVRMGEYFASGKRPEPLGSGSPNIVPSQSFKTPNGFIDVEAATQETWRKLCQAIDMVHLIEDPRFETNADRVKNRTQLVELLQSRFLESSRENWLEVLEKHDVPCAPVVWSVKDLYTNPQIAANELIMTKEHPATGWVRVPAVPWVMSRTPATYKGVGPTVGQHQDEVLAEVGEVRDPNEKTK